MATEILQKDGTALVWAHSADYSSTVSGLAQTSGAELDLTGLGIAAARQGTKEDFGATRAHLFAVFVGIEFDAAPVSLETVDFYLSQSSSSTDGNANPGGCSGTDAAYTGSGADSLVDSLPQLTFLGSLSATVDIAATVQYQRVGTVGNLMRYGSIVVVNNGSQIFEGDAVEMFVAFIPLITESQ